MAMAPRRAGPGMGARTHGRQASHAPRRDGMNALSRPAVHGLMAESTFPLPLRSGNRAVRWVELA